MVAVTNLSSDLDGVAYVRLKLSEWIAMEVPTPENRPSAPGELGLVQEFMNSGHLQAPDDITNAAATIRRRYESGESQFVLAREFGLTPAYISAVGRGAPIAEELVTPEVACEWLAARGMIDPTATMTAEELADLIEFRELLRVLAAGNNGTPIGESTLLAFDRIAAKSPLVVAYGGATDLKLLNAADGARGTIGWVLSVIVEARSSGNWQRLKRCPAHGCPFTFFDSSRNRTGTWCSMLVCGNRTKVRNYQQRRRTTGATTS